MRDYDLKALSELKRWQLQMEKRPTLFGKLSKGMQNKVNEIIPEKVHQVVTTAIKHMVKAALTGSEYTTQTAPLLNLNLAERESLVLNRLSIYKRTAALEGAGTGAGGILLGLADFPLLLGIKMKFLFEVAGLYGFNTLDIKERLFILHIFQLAFSSRARQTEIYHKIRDWQETAGEYTGFSDLNSIDWRRFQQEYRDYIDLAKMFQLVPGIGAAVGAVANFRLLDKLGNTAMNCYRLRLLQK